MACLFWSLSTGRRDALLLELGHRAWQQLNDPPAPAPLILPRHDTATVQDTALSMDRPMHGSRASQEHETISQGRTGESRSSLRARWRRIQKQHRRAIRPDRSDAVATLRSSLAPSCLALEPCSHLESPLASPFQHSFQNDVVHSSVSSSLSHCSEPVTAGDSQGFSILTVPLPVSDSTQELGRVSSPNRGQPGLISGSANA